MLNDSLLSHAIRYVSGSMPAEERESFEILLEYHGELRREVARLAEVGLQLTLAGSRMLAEVPPGLKARTLARLATGCVHRTPAALVVTNGAGLIEWVNPAFTQMCGHPLSELRGRKPGHVLQGPATDFAAVERMRRAIHERRPCREILTNYHRDGTIYHAAVRIAPILDEAGKPLWYVAREHQLPDGAA